MRLLLLTLLAGALYPQASGEELLAPEYIRVLKGIKDYSGDNSSGLEPIFRRYLKAYRTWEKDRLTREFETFWKAGKEETSNEYAQGTYYKTATMLFHHPKYGEELARIYMNDVLDAAESMHLYCHAPLEHISRLILRDLPAETVSRMAMLASVMMTRPHQAFTGGFLMKLAATADAANPKVLKVMRSLLATPRSEQYKIYGGYLNGVFANQTQLSKPAVRQMLQELIDRSELEEDAKTLLALKP